MKKIITSLPFILLIAVVLGIILGQVFSEQVMLVVVTIKYILGQFINFCVPLIIIGFIAPSITKLGSNVGRVLGRKAALFTLAGDILKTVCAVVLSRFIYPQLEDLATAWAGLGATLGHVFPAWHRFKGGKGVTTIASTIILVNPLLGWLAGVVGVAAIILSGYLSVAAVIAMAFYAVAMLFLGHPEVAFIAVVFQAITIRCHWSKLAGIKDGTTHRAGVSIRFWNLVRGKRD